MGPRRRHVHAAAARVIGAAVGPCRAEHADIRTIDLIENAPVAAQRASAWSFIAPSDPLSLESIDRELMEQRGARAASLEANQLDAKLGPYPRADVFARWCPSSHCALKPRIENLTDVDCI